MTTIIITLINEKNVYAVDFSNSIEISVNTENLGSVSDGYRYECNSYRFEVPDDGTVTVVLSYPRQSSTSDCWTVRLYNSEYTLIEEMIAKGNYEQTSMLPIGLAKGDYYLTVASAYEYSARSTDIYTLQVNYSESEFWEKEFNEDFGSATQILSGLEYSGTIRSGYKYEHDYYRFEIAEDGVVDVSMSYGRQGNSSAVWNFTLYNKECEEIYTQTAYGNVEKTSMPSMGLPAGEYFVKVQSYNEYRSFSTDTYKLKVDFSSSDRWEKEFNDEFNTANEIILNEKYYGTIRDGRKYEDDIYKFTLTENGYIDASLLYDRLGKTDAIWEMRLYNAELQLMCWAYAHGNVEETKMTTMGLSAGDYYIMVLSVNDYSAISTEKYSVVVNFVSSDNFEKEFNNDFNSANPVTINKYFSGTTKGGGHYEHDYFYFDTSRSGQYVFRFTALQQNTTDYCWKVRFYDENYKEFGSIDIKGNKTNCYNIITLNVGRYYINVESTGYSDPTTTDVYTFAVCDLEPVGTQIKSLTTSKNVAKLSWKKDAEADGYEIQYSTKKSFESKYTNSEFVKDPDKISQIINRLKSKKKYYFRIRSYATYSIDGVDKVFYSKWSKTKSKKIK